MAAIAVQVVLLPALVLGWAREQGVVLRSVLRGQQSPQQRKHERRPDAWHGLDLPLVVRLHERGVRATPPPLPKRSRARHLSCDLKRPAVEPSSGQSQQLQPKSVTE